MSETRDASALADDARANGTRARRLSLPLAAPCPLRRDEGPRARRVGRASRLAALLELRGKHASLTFCELELELPLCSGTNV